LQYENSSRSNPDIIYAHSSKVGAIARVANIGMKKLSGEKSCVSIIHMAGHSI